MDEKHDAWGAGYNDAARAMTEEEKSRRAREQLDAMQNARPLSGDYMRGMAQSVNMWPQMPPDVTISVQYLPTRWQRFKAALARHCWW